jgi:hypothetical protein
MHTYTRFCINIQVLLPLLLLLASSTYAEPPAKPRDYLAKPSEIELSGNVRREIINSPLGSISVRWPRKTESLFGRTPLKALSDAAQTVSKALSRGSIPTELQRLNLPWQVIFLDEDLPELQIPAYLISNCHPGWMTAPANIYIVAQRVAGGCQSTRVGQGVADAELTEVLIHEMGHAVEHALLGFNFGNDRMRAEGFATWFANYASQFSSLLNRRIGDEKLKAAAKLAIQQSPTFVFQGSYLDYQRAASFFRVIEERKGVTDVFAIEQLIAKNGTSLMVAIEKRTSWDTQTLDHELRKYLGLSR